MRFGFQAVNLHKISWKKAVKTYSFSLKKWYFCCSDSVATLNAVMMPNDHWPTIILNTAMTEITNCMEFQEKVTQQD